MDRQWSASTDSGFSTWRSFPPEWEMNALCLLRMLNTKSFICQNPQDELLCVIRMTIFWSQSTRSGLVRLGEPCQPKEFVITDYCLSILPVPDFWIIEGRSALSLWPKIGRYYTHLNSVTLRKERLEECASSHSSAILTSRVASG